MIIYFIPFIYFTHSCRCQTAIYIKECIDKDIFIKVSTFFCLLYLSSNFSVSIFFSSSYNTKQLCYVFFLVFIKCYQKLRHLFYAQKLESLKKLVSSTLSFKHKNGHVHFFYRNFCIHIKILHLKIPFHPHT